MKRKEKDMGKESFKNLYPLIEQMAKGQGMLETISHISNAMMSIAPAQLKEEAKKALGLMDAYKPPVLPFQHIDPDAMKKEYERLEENYSFVIWNSFIAGTNEACADIVHSDPEQYLGWTEEDVRQVSIEANNEDLENLKAEFESIPINGLIVTGSVERWDGRRPAFGVRSSLEDIFEVFTDMDDGILYIKDGQLRADAGHHDGTNSYVFYTCKEGIDPEDICYGDIEGKHPNLESLVPVLSKHFGWELQDNS